MKKIIVILIICVICFFSLVGCDMQQVDCETIGNKSMFVQVENTGSWYVVYHKDTKVMYTVSNSRYNYGNFTVLLDENGKPLLWQGE